MLRGVLRNRGLNAGWVRVWERFQLRPRLLCSRGINPLALSWACAHKAPRAGRKGWLDQLRYDTPL
jgi:hypothetical protein